MGLPQTGKETKGYVAIVLASILFGTIGILAKLAFQYAISPATLIALRLTVSSTTLLIILAMFRRGSLKIRKTDALAFLFFGVFAVAFQRITYFYAIDLTTATVAAMLFYTYPVFVILSASLIQKKEKITTLQVGAIALTFLGVALVVKIYDFSQLKVSFWGIVFGILSSILFAVYFLMTGRLRRTYSNLTLTLFGDGIGALVLMPVIVSDLSQISQFPAQLWLIVLAIGWIPSLLAYSSFSYALKYVKASRGTMLNVLEPVATAVLSATVIGEAFENLQIIGAVLALAGVLLLFRTGKTFPSDKAAFQHMPTSNVL
jgi:drug/metabolite transporter (DMT)-like permease